MQGVTEMALQAMALSDQMHLAASTNARVIDRVMLALEKAGVSHRS
jgi:hypothetical protein